MPAPLLRIELFMNDLIDKKRASAPAEPLCPRFSYGISDVWSALPVNSPFRLVDSQLV